MTITKLGVVIGILVANFVAGYSAGWLDNARDVEKATDACVYQLAEQDTRFSEALAQGCMACNYNQWRGDCIWISPEQAICTRR